MDSHILELLSVETLKRVREELGGYLQDHLKDALTNPMIMLERGAFEVFLDVDRVLNDKEGT